MNDCNDRRPTVFDILIDDTHGLVMRCKEIAKQNPEAHQELRRYSTTLRTTIRTLRAALEEFDASRASSCNQETVKQLDQTGVLQSLDKLGEALGNRVTEAAEKLDKGQPRRRSWGAIKWPSSYKAIFEPLLVDIGFVHTLLCIAAGIAKIERLRSFNATVQDASVLRYLDDEITTESAKLKQFKRNAVEQSREYFQLVRPRDSEETDFSSIPEVVDGATRCLVGLVKKELENRSLTPPNSSSMPRSSVHIRCIDTSSQPSFHTSESTGSLPCFSPQPPSPSLSSPPTPPPKDTTLSPLPRDSRSLSLPNNALLSPPPRDYLPSAPPSLRPQSTQWSNFQFEPSTASSIKRKQVPQPTMPPLRLDDELVFDLGKAKATSIEAYTRGEIYGRGKTCEVSALINKGFKRNVITKDLATKLKLEIEPLGRREDHLVIWFSGADEEADDWTEPVVGRTCCKLYSGGNTRYKMMEHEFLVCEKMMSDMALGSPFIESEARSC